MDQGNTDPNNPTPNNPTPGGFSEPLAPPSTIPVTPVAPSSFMADTPQAGAVVPTAAPTAPVSVLEQPLTAPPVSDAGASNWANPISSTAPATPPQQEANPFSTPADAPPASFNPFSSPTTGSTPPTPEPFPSSPEPAPSEAVPTDLSNLVNTTSEATNYMPQSQTPESLVVPPPQTSGGDVNQAVPASGGRGFPKIVFIIGGIILLAVIGASAYFILGIGKPSEPLPVSVPAEQQATPTPVTKAPVTPVATQSGSFSDLPGNTVSPTTTPSAGGSKSAYDLLMQQKKTATDSATP